MNVLLALSHSIEEYDQVRLFHELGISVASLGGYIDPAHPHDDKRPALAQVPMVAVVKQAVDGLGQPDNLRAAQERIPEAVLDWADVIVFHHYLDRLYGQFDRIERWLREKSHRRVIWRTVGQSVDGNEFTAQQYRNRGMEIVRYSPKERNIPNYAGEDALIRFYKDPDEWNGWTGETEAVGNVTQDLQRRDPYTNWGFWRAATEGLPTLPAGPGSENIGGLGSLAYDQMRDYLRRTRVYLYTGTQPASYTLGLIEAMMTGVPIVSIGPQYMRIFPYGPTLFEGHELAMSETPDGNDWRGYSAEEANRHLRFFLDHPNDHSALFRAKAIELFGKANIARQWAAYLGVAVPRAVAA